MPQNPAGGEKSEPATPRRREEVRKRGQVARSVDLTAALQLLVALAALLFLVPAFSRELIDLLRYLFETAGTTRLSAGSVPGLATALLVRLLGFFGPLFAALVATALIINAAQVGIVFTGQALTPKPERINPLSGLQRMFSLRSFVELIKSVLKLVIIALTAYLTVRAGMGQFLLAGRTETNQIAVLIGTLAFQVGFRCGLALLLIGILDYAFQRYQFEQDIRMTKEEVRQEMKDFEGDPQVRARVRRVRRQLAQQRMMAEVPTADVVVTNPTFLAIAVKYDVEAMAAPVVVAKGARLVAERIRTLATAHEVPIVENAPLAQALFKAVEVNQAVPPALYRAVAEVLAFVYQISQRSRRKWADLQAEGAAA